MTNTEEEFKLERLSPSSISLFEQCPLKWKFQYVDGLREPAGPAAVLGTFVHSVLEYLMQLPQGKREVEAARKIATEQWELILSDDDFKQLEIPEEELRLFKQDSWRKITGLWELEDPNEVEVVATEMKMATSINGVPFFGIIDRLDRTPNGLQVGDYKSGKAPSPRYEDDKCDQLFLYAAAIEAETGEAPKSIRLMYLGQRAIERPVNKRKISTQHSRMENAWNSIHESLHTGEWEPRTGPLCAWCPYVDMCPAGIEEVERRYRIGRVREDAPALKILGLA